MANLKASLGSAVYRNPYQDTILSSGLWSPGATGLELLSSRSVTKNIGAGVFSGSNMNHLLWLFGPRMG